MKRDPKDRPQISPFINLPSYKLNKSFYLTRLYTRSKDVVTQVEDSQIALEKSGASQGQNQAVIDAQTEIRRQSFYHRSQLGSKLESLGSKVGSQLGSKRLRNSMAFYSKQLSPSNGLLNVEEFNESQLNLNIVLGSLNELSTQQSLKKSKLRLSSNQKESHLQLKSLKSKIDANHKQNIINSRN